MSSKNSYAIDKKITFSVNGEVISAFISSGNRSNSLILEILSESNPDWENIIIEDVIGESDGNKSDSKN